VSRQIDIDPDIFDYLKSKAEPLVDTPSTVLRRLLGLEPLRGVDTPPTVAGTSPAARAAPVQKIKKRTSKAAPVRTRAAPGTLLPEERYEMPLLRALVDAGGQSPYRDVVEAVGRELKDALMPADLENLSSGAIRWQSRLQFVRLRLIERGYLDRDAPRGIWGITDAGRKALDEGRTS
jgi:hypothetical protein